MFLKTNAHVTIPQVRDCRIASTPKHPRDLPHASSSDNHPPGLLSLFCGVCVSLQLGGGGVAGGGHALSILLFPAFFP